MTVLLLDTHAFAWALRSPERLSKRARAAVADPTNALLVSAATAWELATKYRTGKWPAAEAMVANYLVDCERLGAQQHPITAADALRAGSLSWEHRDPFDRMLAVQAMGSHATLVTRDRLFSDLPGLAVLW